MVRVAFSVPIPASGISPPGLLDYVRQPLAKVQARFRDRDVVTPDIDLRAYRCTAVIDWVEVRLHLKRRTQWRYVRNEFDEYLLSPWVTGPDGEKRHTGSEFRVRVQDVDLRQLDHALSQIDQVLLFEQTPEIVGLEVSVDFYPKSKTELDRRKMVDVLIRHLLPRESALASRKAQPRSIRQRVLFVSPQQHGYDPPQITRILEYPDEAPSLEATYYIGERNGPVMYRVMEKVLETVLLGKLGTSRKARSGRGSRSRCWVRS